ncbi:carcinoembryonic antigen-related cell adhesion molecule 3-like [Acomys russatus]|uniref:carcinoembryonic antigen-related cell adhesion molecule 3-like n=1 Tax=Acomys russatus TaxID=60746 RepID=UPI0021E2D405|nr:carcinoembryonic antigen-related cell adhesion molecule 3-like [Acomys russatus]
MKRKSVQGSERQQRLWALQKLKLFSSEDITVRSLMVVSSMVSFKENFWQGLLLMASLLSCWHPTTTTQMGITFVPFPVFEGTNVILQVINLPDTHTSFAWFKEITEKSHEIALYAVNAKGNMTGRAYSGRETIYSDGSLQIRNVTQKDTGHYILEGYNRQAKLVSVAPIYLLVYSSPSMCGRPPTSVQPSIELVPPYGAKGGNVLLRVHNLPEKLRTVSWYKGVAVFKNEEISQYIIAKKESVEGPAHSGRETVYNDGSLLIHNVTRKDTGFYTLRTLSTDLKEEVVHVQLLVDASYLTCGPLPTATQLRVESVPPRVSEGGSALLLVHNLPRNVRVIFWYKGVVVFQRQEVAYYTIGSNSSRKGPAHSGRETLYSNGSLLIHNVTWNHIGFYILRLHRTNMREQVAYVQLQMDASLSTCCNHLTSAPLIIDQVPQNVAKGENVVLHVYNLPQDLRAFSWYKYIHGNQRQKIAEYSRDMNSIIRGPKHSRRMTVYTNGSLFLHSIREKDAGFYTLETLNREFKIATIHARLDINACIHPSTTGQLIIEPVPPNIVDGSNALLVVHNMPEKLQAFYWYKWVGILYKSLIYGTEITTNRRMLGPAYSGRETVYPNGSLLLENVTQEDTRLYTLRILNMQLESQETHAQLHIYKPLIQPFLWVPNSIVRVQSSVVLTCLSDDTEVSTEWFFNDQELQLTERMTLSPARCWLKIDPVRLEDSGKYMCEISNPIFSSSSPPIFLAVIKA